uniref:uncharacterized protein LOC120338210 n=1 Tax=Styela clava TaxID=7725 RepID=UPI00193AA9AC|nr:uncharacterized protein LOC120338210 [Styela clava]
MNYKMKITPVLLLCCFMVAKALQFEEFDYNEDFDENLLDFLDKKNIEAEIDRDFDDDADLEQDLESNLEAEFERDFEPDYERDLEKSDSEKKSFCEVYNLCEKEGGEFKIGCAKFGQDYVHNNVFPNVWRKLIANLN